MDKLIFYLSDCDKYANINVNKLVVLIKHLKNSKNNIIVLFKPIIYV